RGLPDGASGKTVPPRCPMPPTSQPELERSDRAERTALGRVRTVSLLRLGIMGVGLAGLVAILVVMIGNRWSVAELQRVEREVKGGQIAAARARLARLALLGFGGVETDYWLGACAEAEGQVDAALAIWARIPAGSSRFANATVRRARLAIEQ